MKILSQFTVLKIPEGVPIRLQKRFFHNLKRQKTLFLGNIFRIFLCEIVLVFRKIQNETLQVRRGFFQAETFTISKGEIPFE